MKENNMHSDGKMDERSVLQNGGKKRIYESQFYQVIAM